MNTDHRQVGLAGFTPRYWACDDSQRNRAEPPSNESPPAAKAVCREVGWYREAMRLRPFGMEAFLFPRAEDART